MSNLVVTTSHQASSEQQSHARAWAERLAVPLALRRGRSIAEVAADEGAIGVLVISDHPPVYYEPGRGLEYFFHPNMAKVRIHNLKASRGDPMIEAMQLSGGDTVLDCTLGRGCDAIVASWVVGADGKVVGIERIPILAALTEYGLANYEIQPADVAAAMRRIKVRQADYHGVLSKTPSASFDIVYFDPIFDQSLKDSPAMEPLRALADPHSVDAAALQEAQRIARRAVVIKQPRSSSYWEQLPFSFEIVAGSASRIEYGILSAS